MPPTKSIRIRTEDGCWQRAFGLAIETVLEGKQFVSSVVSFLEQQVGNEVSLKAVSFSASATPLCR